jgi:hypothetical protein
LIDDGQLLEEISDPQLTLPTGIHEGQIKKYFKIDDVFVALVLKGSMNINLEVPNDFVTSFTGILVAKEGETDWKKSIEVKDANGIVAKNNPFYLTIDEGQLILTVVDSRGAGSGEGRMKVFSLDDEASWSLKSCYYFGGNYGDPLLDGDYFAYSTQFEKQEPLSLGECSNMELIQLKS